MALGIFTHIRSIVQHFLSEARCRYTFDICVRTPQQLVVAFQYVETGWCPHKLVSVFRKEVGKAPPNWIRPGALTLVTKYRIGAKRPVLQTNCERRAGHTEKVRNTSTIVVGYALGSSFRIN